MTDETLDTKALEEKVVNAIRTVYDPEIPINIWEVGLIYAVDIDDQANVTVTMTLTSPACPVAESLPIEVQEKVEAVSGVASAKVDLTWDPPWTPDMMSEAAKLQLGWM